VHTSTVTVAVVDNIQETENVRDQDLKIEWYSGTGAGGQHRNKCQNSCRITHIPTGIVGRCSTRSRSSSYEGARKIVASRVNESLNAQQTGLISNTRKQQVGSGMRGDKIRTYRFQEDQVTDHKSGKTAKVSKVLKGNFELLW
jgi:peptide chain release factor 1